MKLAALLFAVVIALAIPLCCECCEEDGGKNVGKRLSHSSDSAKQQPLKEESLKVIAASRKWLEGVINESRRTDSHLHNKIKRAFEEMKGKRIVRRRAKRWAGSLTSCLGGAAVSAIGKACDASEWTACHIVPSVLRTVKKVVDIASGNAVLQKICEHLGELGYDVTQFLRQLACEWAQAAYENNLPWFIKKYVCYSSFKTYGFEFVFDFDFVFDASI